MTEKILNEIKSQIPSIRIYGLIPILHPKILEEEAKKFKKILLEAYTNTIKKIAEKILEGSIVNHSIIEKEEDIQIIYVHVKHGEHSFTISIELKSLQDIYSPDFRVSMSIKNMSIS